MGKQLLRVPALTGNQYFNNILCSPTIYIFDSDLVGRMQLMIIKGSKYVLCVGNF